MMLKKYAVVFVVLSMYFESIKSSDEFIQAKILLINNDIPTFMRQLDDKIIHEIDALGSSLLHIAVMANNGTAVQQLIFAGADVNQVDGEGNSPLMLSIRYNCDRVILNLLLDAGADPRLINNAGQNVLDFIQQILSSPYLNIETDLDTARSIQQELQNRADLLHQQELQQAKLAQHAANGRARAAKVRADREAEAQEEDRVRYLNYDL